jgi:hypothetical protein
MHMVLATESTWLYYEDLYSTLALFGNSGIFVPRHFFACAKLERSVPSVWVAIDRTVS